MQYTAHNEFPTYFDLSNYWLLHLYTPEIEAAYRNTMITHGQANNKQLSGNSRFMGRDPERRFRDGLVGNFGNVGLNILLYGRQLGLIKYQQTRDEANANPDKGDNGRDCPDFQIDIKGSGWYFDKEKKWRYKQYDLITQKPNGLLCRPYEMGRREWVNGSLKEEQPYWKDQLYIHFFAQTAPHAIGGSKNPYCHMRENHSIIVITGWLWGTELTTVALGPQYGSHDGAYCCPIPELHPMTTFPIRDIWWVQQGMKKEIL